MKLLRWIKDALIAVLFMALLLLMGCRTTEEVVVRLPPPPVIQPVPKPVIPQTSPPAEKAREIRLYIQSLEEKVQELMRYLDAYR